MPYGITTLGAIKKYHFASIGMDANFSGGSLSESVHTQNERNLSKEKFVTYAKLLTVLDDVVENARLIEVHDDKYAGTHRYNSELESIYVLISGFVDKDSFIPV